MSTALIHPYFDFLIAKSNNDDALQGLDPASQRFLEMVALQHFKGQNLTMMEALGLCRDLGVGESTLSKRIKGLQADGLIEVVVDDADRRIKVLYPSQKTSRYFHALSQSMLNISLHR